MTLKIQSSWCNKIVQKTSWALLDSLNFSSRKQTICKSMPGIWRTIYHIDICYNVNKSVGQTWNKKQKKLLTTDPRWAWKSPKETTSCFERSTSHGNVWLQGGVRFFSRCLFTEGRRGGFLLSVTLLVLFRFYNE